MMYPYILLRRLMVLLLCSLAAGVSLAQEDAQEGVPDDEPIDEITVYGEKSLPKLKLEYEAAELNFYNLYNEINDDYRYDVICRDEVPTGSHIKTARLLVPLRTRGARAGGQIEFLSRLQRPG